LAQHPFHDPASIQANDFYHLLEHSCIDSENDTNVNHASDGIASRDDDGGVYFDAPVPRSGPSPQASNRAKTPSAWSWDGVNVRFSRTFLRARHETTAFFSIFSSLARGFLL
jgi:hypothetical protein